jgi:hypothetical protein
LFSKNEREVLENKMIETQRLYQKKVEEVKCKLSLQYNCEVDVSLIYSYSVNPRDTYWEAMFIKKDEDDILAFCYVNDVDTTPIMTVNFIDKKACEEVWLI